MRNVSIDKYMRDGARELLKRLIEMGVLSVSVPKLVARGKLYPKAQRDRFYVNTLIKDLLGKPMLLEAFILDEEIVPIYGRMTEENGKEWLTLTFEVKK